MNDSVNDKVNEIYAITQEECAEVIQAISKVMRFGLDAVHNGRSNRDHLEEEVGDLMCMIDLLSEVGVLDIVAIAEAGRRKRLKLQQWSNIFKEQE
jgi:NTP pyrophosphatase (non-canonical NTP hydrolase)